MKRKINEIEYYENSDTIQNDYDLNEFNIFLIKWVRDNNIKIKND